MRNRASQTVHPCSIRMSLMTGGIICFVAAAMLISCGRRGDPVLLSPEDREEVIQEMKDAGAEQSDVTMQETPEARDALIYEPAAPDGLTALFTGSAIVLAWNDIIDGTISAYRVYRSAGDGFVLVGETVSPAYTDRDITAGTTYSYYVTAVGQTEGLPSDRIMMKTEKR